MHIQLVADKAKVSLDEVIASSERKAANLPIDIVCVKDSCQEEITKHAHAILDVVSGLGGD